MATYKLGTSGAQFNHRRDFYPQPYTFAELYPLVTPFLSRLYEMGPQDISNLPDPTYTMFEYEAGWRYEYFQVDGSPSAWSNSGNPSTGTTVDIDIDGINGLPSSATDSWIGLQVVIYDSDKTTRKGVARVHAVTDSDTLTLKGIGNPESANETMTDLADDDYIYVVGSAFGEESTAPDAHSDELEAVRNSCQIERNALQVSKIVMKAALRGEPNELLRQRMVKANEHKIRCSRTLLYGHRLGGIGGTAHNAGGGTDSTTGDSHTTDASSDTVRTTMGLFSAFHRYGITSDDNDQQNVFTRVKANYTYDDFVDDSEKIFQYSPSGGVKVAYCGPGALSFWSKVGADGLKTSSGQRINVSMTDPQETALGLRFRELHTPHGVVQLVRDEVLRGMPEHSWMYIVDEDNIGLVQYESDEFRQNIETDNAPNYQKDEFYSNMGLKLCLMKSHALIKLT